jgi:hypothetical protein
MSTLEIIDHVVGDGATASRLTKFGFITLDGFSINNTLRFLMFFVQLRIAVNDDGGEKHLVT